MGGKSSLINTNQRQLDESKGVEALTPTYNTQNTETLKVHKHPLATEAAIMDTKTKGRYRNKPCACGSGIKNKKCCGKGA